MLLRVLEWLRLQFSFKSLTFCASANEGWLSHVSSIYSPDNKYEVTPLFSSPSKFPITKPSLGSYQVGEQHPSAEQGRPVDRWVVLKK